MDPARHGQPPGWRFNPLQLGELFHNPEQLLARTRDQHGDPFSVWSPGKPLILTGTREGAQEIFSADPASFAAYGAEVLAPFLGRQSVLLLSGNSHRAERRLLMPPFHGKRLRAYGEIIRTAARRTVDSLPPGTISPTLALAQDTTLEVIVRAVFGVDQAQRVAEVRSSVEAKLSAITPWIVFFPALRRNLLGIGPWARFERLDTTARRLLHETIASKRNAPPGEDILSLLLGARHEDGSPMPDDDIVDELMTLLFAGHETTAITLAWAMQLLHSHPDTLERLHRELETVADDTPADTIASLPWLSAVVDETLRIRPVVPLVARTLEREFVLRGWKLPPGTGVGVSILLLHRDPQTYPEPFAFRPERFLDRTFSPFEYAPFGGGARRCIGAAFAQYEAKLVLAEWLRLGKFTLADTATPALERRNVTLAPRGGVPIRRVD
jgi:cytochrome P450